MRTRKQSDIERQLHKMTAYFQIIRILEHHFASEEIDFVLKSLRKDTSR